MKSPLVIPVVLAIGLVLFAIGMVVTGSSIATRAIGPLAPARTVRLVRDVAAVDVPRAHRRRLVGGARRSGRGSLTAVFVAVIAILFNISGTEVVLNRDLDTNEELRNAGVLNVISGALGGIPGYHALSLTALAERMNVDARVAGLIAAASRWPRWCSAPR